MDKAQVPRQTWESNSTEERDPPGEATLTLFFLGWKDTISGTLHEV